MLLHNLFFPIVPAIVGRHLFRSMLEKKSTEKSKESWSLTFFSKSQTHWEICAKFLVLVINNHKNVRLAHCAQFWDTVEGDQKTFYTMATILLYHFSFFINYFFSSIIFWKKNCKKSPTVHQGDEDSMHMVKLLSLAQKVIWE